MPKFGEPFLRLLRQEHQRLLHQLRGRKLLRHRRANLPERPMRTVHYSREQLWHQQRLLFAELLQRDLLRFDPDVRQRDVLFSESGLQRRLLSRRPELS